MNEDVVFGLWSQGDSSGFHAHIDARSAKDIIKSAYKHGIRSFDTAFSYKDANSLLFSALRELGVKTGGVSITLKIMPCPSFLKKVEAGLRALRSDHVDTLMIHWPAEDKILLPALSELVRLKEKGVCSRTGVSNFPIGLIERISPDYGLSVHQRPVSAIWKKNLEKESLSIQGYGALGFGTLCKMETPSDRRKDLYIYKEASGAFSDLIKAVNDIAERHSASMAEVSFSYSRGLYKGQTIIGASTAGQLELVGKTITLEEEEKKLLDLLSDRLKEFQTSDNIFFHGWRDHGHTC